MDVNNQFQLLEVPGEEGEPSTTVIPQVQTYGCLGQPGFVYLVGCVHEGMPQTKRSSTSVKPPFKDCIAINSLCGASCSSGAYEPTIYNPSRPDMFERQKDTHCVTPETQVGRDADHHWTHHQRAHVEQGDQVSRPAPLHPHPHPHPRPRSRTVATTCFARAAVVRVRGSVCDCNPAGARR